MSDFINHLVMRHLGTGEKVLPRSHALFETNPEAISLPVEDPVIKNVESIDLGREHTAAKRTESAVSSVQTGNRNPEVNSPAAVILALHKSDTGAMETPVSSTFHKSIHAAGREENQPFPGAGHPLHPPHPPIPGEIGGNAPALEKQEPFAQTHAADFSLNPAMNPPGQRSRESVTGDQGTLVTPVPQRVPARINPRQGKSPHEPALRDAQTGMNRLINVSIGRIEVRASQPAPEMPQRREKPTGVMTLEQYLNRYSKGGTP